METNREQALAAHLGIELDEIKESVWGDNAFEAEKNEYLVLTDEEADKVCHDYIEESLWAFKVSFLARYTDALKDPNSQKAWEKIMETACERANPIVRGLLGANLDKAIDDAIREDGRGAFLAQYDSKEHSQKTNGVTYFIYRVN